MRGGSAFYVRPLRITKIMSIDLTSLNLVEKFIVEHGSATVMGVHISYLREQLSGFDRQLASLKDENADLKATNKNLVVEIDNLRTKIRRLEPAGLYPFAGVLWKPAGGGFERTPYCPQCASHPVMFGQPPMGGDPMLWQCSVCGFTADFSGRPR